MHYRQGLRFKINLSITLILLTVTLVFGAALTIYEIQRHQLAIRDIEVSLQNLTTQYSEPLGNEIFAAQTMAIEATLKNILKKNGMLAIIAYDEFGDVLVSTDPAGRESLSEDLMAQLESGPTAVKGRWHHQPALTFTSRIEAYGEEVGFWRIQYSLATLKRQTRNIIFIFTALMLTLAVLIGFMLNRFLARFVLKPVSLLNEAMRHIQGGDQEAGRSADPETGSKRLGAMIEAFDELPKELDFTPGAEDEIGSLARSFRQMLFALKDAFFRMRIDPLTGLCNRLRIDEALKSELDRAQRYGNHFSVMMLDIDHFKRVNDTHGHLTGDQVLVKMAAILKQALRSTDLPGRWGGEEFIVLLPHQDLDHALLVAEKLRSLIESTHFGDAGRITSSFGVVQYRSEKTISDLVHKADDALYRAKHLGRNRVETA